MPTAIAILKIARLNAQTRGPHPHSHCDHRHRKIPKSARVPKSSKVGTLRYVEDGRGELKLVFN